MLRENTNTIWVYDLSAEYENRVEKGAHGFLPPLALFDGYWSADINFSASKKWLRASGGMAGIGKAGFINAYSLETNGRWRVARGT